MAQLPLPVFHIPVAFDDVAGIAHRLRLPTKSNPRRKRMVEGRHTRVG